MAEGEIQLQHHISLSAFQAVFLFKALVFQE